eukprot:4738474-Prymnesium_polylepis.1
MLATHARSGGALARRRQSYTECDEVCDALEAEQQRLKRIYHSKEQDLGKMRARVLHLKGRINWVYQVFVLSMVGSVATGCVGAWRAVSTGQFWSSIQVMAFAWCAAALARFSGATRKGRAPLALVPTRPLATKWAVASFWERVRMFESGFVLLACAQASCAGDRNDPAFRRRRRASDAAACARFAAGRGPRRAHLTCVTAHVLRARERQGEGDGRVASNERQRLECVKVHTTPEQSVAYGGFGQAVGL